MARVDIEGALTFADAAEVDAGTIQAVTRLAQITLIRADAHLARGEPRRGLRILEVGSDGALRHLPDHLEARRRRSTVLLHLAAGDVGRARRLIEQDDRPFTTDFDAHAAYAIATRNDRLLRVVIDNRHESHDPVDRVVWLAADAHLSLRVGDPGRTLDRLRLLAPIVIEQGLLQPIRDIGVHLAELLDGVDDEAELGALRRFEEARAGAVHFAGVRVTDREQQVLEAIASFIDDDELASRLGVSPNTVKTHRRSLFRKLKVTSRGEAVRRGEQVGLLAPPGPRCSTVAGCLPLRRPHGGGGTTPVRSRPNGPIPESGRRPPV